VKVHLYDKYRPTLLLPKTASLANYLVTRRQEFLLLGRFHRCMVYEQSLNVFRNDRQFIQIFTKLNYLHTIHE